MKKQGFTLAEVLITLGIIGVVAAMTIPTLMANSQKQQYVTGLKKAYTITNSALIQMASDYGCTGDLKCTGLFESGTSAQTLGKEFVKYFKVAKDCEVFSESGISGCFSNSVHSVYEGTDATFSFDDTGYRFITADAMSFIVLNNADGCPDYGWSKHITNDLTSVCGAIYVDVNGLKKPNTVGRDIFYFNITNGKGPMIYPSGGADWDGRSWVDLCKPGGTESIDCSARIMEEGWQMNY